MATIAQVARRAGVSTATVSRALSGKGNVSPATLARVHAAANALGYVASVSATSLASGRTQNIGIVLPFLESWFYNNVMAGAHSVFSDHDYDTTLYRIDSLAVGGGIPIDSPRRKRLFQQVLRRGRVDALLSMALELTPEEVHVLDKLGKPIVGIGGRAAGVYNLVVDDYGMAWMATQHLIQLGHRDIVHIGGNGIFEKNFEVPTLRWQAFQDALEQAGLPTPESSFMVGDFTVVSGYESGKKLLQRAVRPTAVFAASDEMAIGLIAAAVELNVRVPEELSIIGIDGNPVGEVFGLTTIDQNPYQQGINAAELMMELVDSVEPRPVHDLEVPYRLLERRSTAPPPPAS